MVEKKKIAADAPLNDAERKKLEEFSSRMFEKYGISENGPMSDRLIDLVLRLRDSKDD